jgi:predicted nuclease with TOPRIM domain
VTTIEERLAAQLDAKDEEIAKLEAEVGELEESVANVPDPSSKLQ